MHVDGRGAWAGAGRVAHAAASYGLSACMLGLTRRGAVCRTVKMAKPDVVSHGGLTTISNYHLIPKSESVVDSVRT